VKRLLPLLLAAGGLNAASPVRVLILSGQNNHDWRSTTPYLKKILLATSGRFDVRVSEEPSSLASKSLEKYDALVVDYQGPRWSPETEKAIEQFVASGHGLVSIHAATYSFCGNEILGDRHTKTGKTEPAWPEWRRMIGACWVKASGHGARHLFDLKPGSHPIVQGMQEPLTISDELYHRQQLEPNAKVIATAYSAKETGGTGQDEPILWTVEYGRGRVFHTALGHDTTAMNSPAFATTFARGLEWAATGTVTLPAKILPDAYKPDPLRTLIVTGGHDHQPAFYTMFEGDGDIDAVTDAQPAALRKNLWKYDVLVFHDMFAGVDEKGRANLQTWAEAGHGIVVIHHALASFNDWDWWSKELVGAKYLLKPEDGRPASTFHHDQVMNIAIAGKHPVLTQVPPMQLMDETYGGMWFSPDITPLLKTDHPKSDPVVTWISPYRRSRVAVIQLGHDRWSHLHPGYRRLVRNAVFWAAGRDPSGSVGAQQ
jgi:type 1 glutamine amidotransferase